MSLYPYVLVLRSDKYKDFDHNFYGKFTYKITDDIQDTKLLYNEHYNVFITVGNSWQEYDIQKLMITKTFRKWLHFVPEDLTPENLYTRIMACYIHNLEKREIFRPKISAFTTSFKSGNKILRPFNSLLNQTINDWEWVIIDDTDGDENFKWLTSQLKDPRIRIYKRNGNSGSIGNVKNEASSLCRGKYLLELDHDDDIMPDCLETLVKGFESDPQVGFVYMDFAELYEDWRNFSYCEGWGFGFGSYYRQFVSVKDGRLDSTSTSGKWLQVAKSCDINNITMSDIIGVPNHPRCWRKDVLQQIGYSEAMAIADDYELLVQTCLNYKILRIAKLGYLQYKNENNNNFSLIRNGEITKLQRAVSAHYKSRLDNFFKEKTTTGLFWARENYIETRINQVKTFDYDKTVLISIDTLTSDKVREYYQNPKIDIILVLNEGDGVENILESLGFYRMKFHIIPKDTKPVDYFLRCYCATAEHDIFISLSDEKKSDL